LQALLRHLHEFDAVSVRILDPGLIVAVDCRRFRLREVDALIGQLADRGVDITDLEAKMIGADLAVLHRKLEGQLRSDCDEQGVRRYFRL